MHCDCLIAESRVFLRNSFWLVLVVAAVDKSVANDEVVQKLDSAIRYEVAEKNLPAFSISLVDGQETLFAAGYGFEDAEGKVPATADTLYRVGSISKLFTDIALMQLVQDEMINYDAPVSDYIPDFAPKNPTDTAITLRQLMTHRSGLVREPPVGHYFDDTEPTLESTVASLNNTELVYPPDTRTKYSNAALAVVGLAIEKVAGKSQPEMVQEKILKPLSMGDSTFLVPDAEASQATGWMWTYDGRRFEAPRFQLGTGPAGNMYSSVNDLAKFLKLINGRGRLGESEILSEQTMKAMIEPLLDSAGGSQDYGLGFRIDSLDGMRKVGHGGAVYGFSTQVELLPEEGVGVAASCALDGANGVVTRLVDYALRLQVAAKHGVELPEYEKTTDLPRQRGRYLKGRYAQVDAPDSVLEINELAGTTTLLKGTFKQTLRAKESDGTICIDSAFSFGTRIAIKGEANIQLGDETFARLPAEVPAAPPKRWEGLIGEYGWDHNTLYILEKDGKLFTLIEWFYYYPLTEVSENVFAFPNYGLYPGEQLVFRRDASGRASEVVAASVLFPRRNVGTVDGKTFQITPVEPIDSLRAAATQATPPAESGSFRKSELVELVDQDPTIKLDIRYATTNNFTGAIFYQSARAFMQKPASEALAQVNAELAKLGLGLLVHDAYRPWYVTNMFWEATPMEMKDFVANPANGSRHNRGCAVDLTLYDRKSGDPIEMVAGYDEFSQRSYPDYPGGTSRQRYYREILRQAMEAGGFEVYEFEWWHFDYKDWRLYRIGNGTFEQLREHQD